MYVSVSADFTVYVKSAVHSRYTFQLLNDSCCPLLYKDVATTTLLLYVRLNTLHLDDYMKWVTILLLFYEHLKHKLTMYWDERCDGEQTLDRERAGPRLFPLRVKVETRRKIIKCHYCKRKVCATLCKQSTARLYEYLISTVVGHSFPTGLNFPIAWKVVPNYFSN